MENYAGPVLDSRTRLLDAGLALLGDGGRGALTVRAAEERAGLPHGSVRHHFGDRRRYLVALVGHAAAVEGAALEDLPPAEAVRHWIGPGRAVALARFELALMATRDPDVRAAYVEARESFIARAGGGAAGRRLVLAVDGLVLDALVRGHVEPDELLGELAVLARLATSPEEDAAS